MHWNNVNENMPEFQKENTSFLVLCVNMNEDYPYMFEGFYDDGLKCWRKYPELKKTEITHWMCKPDLPKTIVAL